MNSLIFWHRIFLSILATGLISAASAQGSATPCLGPHYLWSNCFGTFTWPSGTTYTGEWKDGWQDGHGTEKSRSGEIYVGQFKEGFRDGHGRFVNLDGRVFEGHFQDNLFLYPAAQRAATPDTRPSVSVRAPGSTESQSPQSKKSSESTSLQFSVESGAPDINGVVSFTVIANKGVVSLKVNGEEVGARADGRYSFNRFAQVGENRFELVAIDSFGGKKTQIVSLSRSVGETVARVKSLDPSRANQSKGVDAVAIIIGIEKYRRVPAADFAGRDASVFYDYARRALGVKPENIRLLVDEKADAAEILRAFRNWLPTRVNKGKTDVYVFYSGHGLPSQDGNQLYLLPYEADRDLLDRTAIAQSEMVEALQRANPKSVTMFIDSCYSGQTRTGETLLASARPIVVAAKQATSFPPNFTVLSASAPDQISSSSPDLKHGIFSYYLMRGMEGEADSNKDKQITVAEMQAYLAENVTKRALGMSRTQQPQVVGDQSRVLVGR